MAWKRAELHEKCSSLKFMLSEESLQLLPEYNQRIEVWEWAYLLYVYVDIIIVDKWVSSGCSSAF